MKKTELLNKINSFISTVFLEETKPLIEVKLASGDPVQYESLEAGLPIFEVTEDGNKPLPIGEYEIEGQLVIVTEEGIIGEVKELPVEEAPVEEAPVEEAVEEIKTATKLEKETVVEVIDPTIALAAEHALALEAVKAEYVTKLAEERARIAVELEALVKEVNLSKVVQAPVVDTAPKVALTPKEKMEREIQRKRNLS